MTLHDYNLLEPNGFTILIVDDDSQNLQILATILSGEKYRISTALSGKQALGIVENISPDLILLDIIMPEMDGFEVCKILKGSPETRDIPVIFVTAKDEQEDILKGFSIGAVDYVTKPFNAAELLARVHTHAELKRKGDNEKELNSLLKTVMKERELAEKVLRESERKFRAIFDQTFQFIGLMTVDGTLIEANRAALRLSGIKESDVIGKPFWETPWWTHSQKLQEKLYAAVQKAAKGEFVRFEATHPAADGSLHCVDFSLKPVMDEAGNVVLLIPEGRDITDRKSAEEELQRAHDTLEQLVEVRTAELLLKNRQLLEEIEERKQSEETLRESEEKYRSLTSTEDSIYLVDRDCRYQFMNEEHLSRFGVSLDKIVGRSYSEFHSEASSKAFMEKVEKVFETGTSTQHEYKSERDGRYFLRTFSPVKDKDGRETITITVVSKDITELKEAEESLRQAEAEYRSIFENAQEGIFQTTPEGQFITANQAMADILGYDSPRELFSAITDIPRQLYVNPEDHEALTQMMKEYGPIKEFETQYYRKDGSKIWASLNIHNVRNSEDNANYYEGMIEDITIRKLSEEERKQSVKRLRKALGATVQAMAYAVETRDPYTAGHQRRVSDLARTIATEMGLSSDKIDGIRMASIIHDIGKISVPAEILSKPTKLNDIEFGLIKIHSQAGYDILKDIEFPWPVDQIILQHHERLDGSGYPRGLSGEEILLEAKILAVADVVEAMASHRPYRPAIGIDKALDEISQNKGILYDHKVVDACCRLFTEKRFSFAHDA